MARLSGDPVRLIRGCTGTDRDLHTYHSGEVTFGRSDQPLRAVNRETCNPADKARRFCVSKFVVTRSGYVQNIPRIACSGSLRVSQLTGSGVTVMALSRELDWPYLSLLVRRGQYWGPGRPSFLLP